MRNESPQGGARPQPPATCTRAARPPPSSSAILHTQPAAHPPTHNTADAPAARLACDEARTARTGGKGVFMVHTHSC